MFLVTLQNLDLLRPCSFRMLSADSAWHWRYGRLQAVSSSNTAQHGPLVQAERKRADARTRDGSCAPVGDVVGGAVLVCLRRLELLLEEVLGLLPAARHTAHVDEHTAEAMPRSVSQRTCELEEPHSTDLRDALLSPHYSHSCACGGSSMTHRPGVCFQIAGAHAPCPRRNLYPVVAINRLQVLPCPARRQWEIPVADGVGLEAWRLAHDAPDFEGLPPIVAGKARLDEARERRFSWAEGRLLDDGCHLARASSRLRHATATHTQSPLGSADTVPTSPPALMLSRLAGAQLGAQCTVHSHALRQRTCRRKIHYLEETVKLELSLGVRIPVGGSPQLIQVGEWSGRTVGRSIVSGASALPSLRCVVGAGAPF